MFQNMVLDENPFVTGSIKLINHKGGSMEKNVGSTDKLIRLILGVVLAVLGIIYLETTLGIIGLILGAVLIITGLVGRCGLYIPFRISTCKVDEQNK